MLSLARSSVIVATLLFLAPAAHAQSAADRATARQLGLDGQEALDKKDYATAEDRFRRADALFHAPTLLLGYARAETGLGKLVNASEAYNRIIREGVPPGASAAFANALEAAKAEAGAVQARIASVTVTVTGPENPTVTLDDQPLSIAALGIRRPVDPGTHVVRATADGWEPAETRFAVADAGNASAALSMQKIAAVGPAAQPSPLLAPTGESPAAPRDTGATSAGGGQRTLGWVGLGVGVAGLATGTITGILAMSKHSDLQTSCANGCPPSTQGDLDSYHMLGTLSTVGFIAGGVLSAAGLVLVITAPHDSTAAAGLRAMPYIGLNSVGATGTF
ncbi:MAG TPA: hypothetical protein VGY54_13020 [Polyangiaceae bacterium]|jgi:hypothetical protein|nr:hypothetical protein [Polyangiaceae bacterium]